MKRALLLLIVPLALGLWTGSCFYNPVTPKMVARSAAKTLLNISVDCGAYANTHDGAYPEGKSSNEAFRKLFQAHITDYERPFRFTRPEGGWSNQEIGTAEDGFSEALLPGECDVYYVRGLNRATSDPKTPFLFACLPRSREIYWVACTISGESIIFPAGDDGVSGEFNGQKLNFRSPDYWKQFGVPFQDVLSPEGPAEDFAAYAATVKKNIRERYLVISAACVLLVILIGLFIRDVRSKRGHGAEVSIKPPTQGG